MKISRDILSFLCFTQFAVTRCFTAVYWSRIKIYTTVKRRGKEEHMRSTGNFLPRIYLVLNDYVLAIV